MKGQSSIEFILVLTLAMLASTILLSELETKSSILQNRQDFSEARQVAMKTAYHVERVKASRNMSLRLDYSPGLENDYRVEMNGSLIEVTYGEEREIFSTRHKGKKLEFNTSESYVLSYDGGVKVE